MQHEKASWGVLCVKLCCKVLIAASSMTAHAVQVDNRNRVNHRWLS